MKEKVKEKAIELIDKFMLVVDELHSYPMCFDTAVQCSLIAINEKLEEVPYVNNTPKECRRRIFLMDVRSELNKYK